MNINSKRRGAETPLLGSKIELVIEKLVVGGSGIARKNDFVFFVPQVAPQDKLIAEVTLVKKNYAEARLLQLLEPGPSRRASPCPYADRCGGCSWQHLSEKEQQNQKERLVFETLKKFNPEIQFQYLPLKPSPKAFRYRNRVQPKYRNGKFGFFARGSHEVVDIHDCLITEEALTQKFAEIRQWATTEKKHDVLKLESYLSEDGAVHFHSLDNTDGGIGFAQVNRFQNEELMSTVLDWAGNENFRTIFDLYAGSGNFTFPLFEKFKSSQIIGVELNQKLVQRAKTKIQSSRMEFYADDVEAYLKKADIRPTDLVLLDPPRAGASDLIMKKLGAAGPKKIIYISCHPVSLARDIKSLLAWAKGSGKNMSLGRVQAFEMFPQTDHVETIAELDVDS